MSDFGKQLGFGGGPDPDEIRKKDRQERLRERKNKILAAERNRNVNRTDRSSLKVPGLFETV